jgi:cytosine/adenosine deaminase-related metal-dependent hydrolase
MSTTVCFSGGIILAGDQMQPLHNAALVVESGRIVSLGEPPSDSEVVDMRGRLLCPMFIDSHTHIGDTGAKDLGIGLTLGESCIPPNGLKHRFLASLDRDTQISMMHHGMVEMLKSGIISFADFREQSIEGALRLRRASEGLPIKPVILGRMAENSSFEEGVDEAEKLLDVADGLGIRDVSSHDNQVIQHLRKMYPDRLFAVHAAECRSEEELSRQSVGKGQVGKALEWGVDFMVHLVHPDPAELKQAAEEGVMAVHCPRSNGVLGDGFADLQAWNGVGLDYALGSDNMMFCSPDMMREMDFASRLVRGLHEDPTVLNTTEILQAATIQGARMLKLDEHLGSLSPGKDASFIVFDLNSPNLRYTHDPVNAVVHRASPADIESVFIRGISLSEQIK